MTAPQCSGPSLGIDIGGTKTQAVLLDASSRVIANRVRRTDRGPDGVVGGALALARECLQLGRTQVTELLGVGVGIPGQVDHCSGVVLHAVNLGIERLELGALLSAELGVAVRVDNDVKATALGAADYLRTPTADLSYINLGTGIASATLVGGRLVRGEGNLAGEIGHLPVDPSAGRCVCGRIGCLEVLAGGRRIAERLAAAGLTLPGLVEATHAGDQAAIDESLRIGGAIATAVQLVVLAHGSARVALGGGVVRTAPGLADLARRQLTERAAGSDFLASLDLPARITLLPGNHPLAAIGAALVGRGAQCHDPSIVCASDPAALGRSDR